MAISDYFDKTITILTKPTTDDGMGGRTGSLSSGNTFLAAMYPLDGSENLEYGRPVESHLFRLYCAADGNGAAVTHANELRYGGNTYQVLAVHTPGQMLAGKSSTRHFKIIAELKV